MAKENVLVVSYGSRGAALADALYRSEADFSIYFADRQRNPFNVGLAERTGGRHAVMPDLGVDKIYEFAKGIEKLRFVLVGPEGPIIEGVADRIQEGLGIPVLAPTVKYAIEKSKARQRELIQAVVPEANPEYKLFSSGCDIPAGLSFMRKLDYDVAIKPDKPGAGKGVVVYGDHFSTEEEAERLFTEKLHEGAVIIEERLDGEESSYMAFSDGRNIFSVPDTRDYKRAFDRDIGPNTGGMGSYMDAKSWLPFMTPGDRINEESIINKIFRHMRKGSYEPRLKGMPYYVAFIHTANGPKILEINSRPGDPEIMNVLPALETDFGEICYGIIEGTLKEIKMKPLATVVIYLVPPPYGGKEPGWRGHRGVNIKELENCVEENSDFVRMYPGSMETVNCETMMMKSRALAVVGMGDTIERARAVSMKSAGLVEGELWSRSDIASEEHIRKSAEHMEKLRCEYQRLLWL